jgi:hypothetical protein
MSFSFFSPFADFSFIPIWLEKILDCFQSSWCFEDLFCGLMHHQSWWILYMSCSGDRMVSTRLVDSLCPCWYILYPNLLFPYFPFGWSIHCIKQGFNTYCYYTALHIQKFYIHSFNQLKIKKNLEKMCLC